MLQGLADGLREAADAGENVDELDNAVSGLAQEFVSGEKNGKEFLTALADMAKEAKNSKGDLKDVGEKTDDVTDAEEKATKQTKVFGDMLKANLVSGAVTKGLGLLLSGIKRIGSVMKESVEAYADYEQLVGGVETLFGDSAKKVVAVANKAFKTAGMSANDYMETSIQSAAALISSLGGDQAQAAALMNMSITDMSDNVNKMGTTMEAVQNAYRGFSRGNFTMLDNLALGFAGTQEGMQELLDKAKEFSGIEYNIDSYADIVQAIHVVQEGMGIAGTTAKEASETISGSLASLKSAWENLKIGFANDNADIDSLIQNVVDGAETAFGNLLPVVEKTLEGIGQFAERIAPILEEKLPGIVEKLSPAIIAVVKSLVEVVGGVLPDLIGTLAPSIVDGVVQIIDGIGDVLAERIPALGLLFENLPVVIEAAFAGKAIVAVSNFAGAISNLTGLMGLAGGAGGAGALATGLGSIGTLITGTIVPALGGLAAAAAPVLAAAAPFLIGGAIVAGIVAGVVLIVKNWDKIKEAAGKLGEAVSEKWEAIKTKTSEIWGNVSQVVSDKLEAAKEYAQKKLDKIKEAYDKHGGGIAGIAAATMEGVKQYYSIGWDAVNELTGGKLGDLADKLKEGLEEARKKFFEFIDKAKDWGKDLIQNFLDGIKQKWTDLKDGIANVGQTIKDFIGFSEPKKGPLSDFHTYAPDMMDLFIQGIRDGENALKRQVASTFDFGNAYTAPTVQAAGVNGYATGIGNQYTGGNISINVYGAQGQDVETLADLVADKVSHIIYTTGERRAMALG